MIIDFRVISRQLGLLLLVLSALLAGIGLFGVLANVWGDAEGYADVYGLFLSSGIGCVFGAGLVLAGRASAKLIGQRDALLLVALSWILGATFAALPYRLWSGLRADRETEAHNFDSYVNCYFEAMSGLTGAGATIVERLETVPQSLLLWRATTHWVGGLGIIVLFVAILPGLGVGARRLYRLETTGPHTDGVRPRIRDTARALWMIYCVMTVTGILLLRIFGMSWFDAVCHTFASVATGGFSTKDQSVGAYPSTGIHLVVIAFMFLSGVNFGLYYQLFRRQWASVWRDPELRAYTGILLVATVVVATTLWLNTPAEYTTATGGRDGGRIARDALFQVTSIQSTTGFTTADYDQWGFAAKCVLLCLMFIGGSSGSTSCGIKVVRILAAFKIVFAELERAFSPRVVRTVRVGKSAVDADLKLDTLVFLLAILGLFVAGTVAIMLLESSGTDTTTAATASIATLNCVGPGLGGVGPTGNYAWFSDPTKGVMCVLMLLGRLEVYTVLVLFLPGFWRES